MKEFYGKVSIAAAISFNLEAENEEVATEIVFEDIQGIDIILKDGSKLEIDEIDWDLIKEAASGNTRQRAIQDFEIVEEE